MALVLRDLAANIAARRARREAAFLAVQALRSEPIRVVGETVASWLRSAYGWQPLGHVAPPDWLLERRGQRLLLRALNGDRRATWQDVDKLSDLGVQKGVNLMAIAAPSGESDPFAMMRTQWEGVRVWGPVDLEQIYVEIEYEGDGIEF